MNYLWTQGLVQNQFSAHIALPKVNRRTLEASLQLGAFITNGTCFRMPKMETTFELQECKINDAGITVLDLNPWSLLPCLTSLDLNGNSLHFVSPTRDFSNKISYLLPSIIFLSY